MVVPWRLRPPRSRAAAHSMLRSCLRAPRTLTCPEYGRVSRRNSQHVVCLGGNHGGKCDRMGSPSLSVNWIDPGQRRDLAPACGADVEAWIATSHFAFTKSEGDPHNEQYRKAGAGMIRGEGVPRSTCTGVFGARSDTAPVPDLGRGQQSAHATASYPVQVQGAAYDVELSAAHRDGATPRTPQARYTRETPIGLVFRSRSGSGRGQVGVRSDTALVVEPRRTNKERTTRPTHGRQ